MNMSSAERPLNQRPEAFKVVGVMFAAHPNVFRVIDRAVVISKLRKIGIGPQFIRADGRTFGNIGHDMRLKRRALHVRVNLGHHIALTFKHSENNRLARRTGEGMDARYDWMRKCKH